MRMVIKFPTRNRPQKFMGVLDRYLGMLSGMHEVHFVISYDHDDPTMNNENMFSYFDRIKSYYPGRIHALCGKSSSKISAVNANLDAVERIDPHVILLASDDMIPIVGGYDDIIDKAMGKYFPDTDGVIHFNDGYSGVDRLITLSILGMKYYRRFGYLYYPGYKSVFPDNEFTNVARMLGKVVYIDHVIIQHQWTGQFTHDDLHKRNESVEMYNHDAPIYIERAQRNFDLKPEEIAHALETLPQTVSLDSLVARTQAVA
jgi:hypothetical protein